MLLIASNKPSARLERRRGQSFIRRNKGIQQGTGKTKVGKKVQIKKKKKRHKKVKH